MNLKKEIAISDNGFVFQPSTGDSYSLNPIGIRILSLIREGKDEKQIRDTLLEEYDVHPSQLEEDLYDFLAYLRQLNLVTDE